MWGPKWKIDLKEGTKSVFSPRNKIDYQQTQVLVGPIDFGLIKIDQLSSEINELF